MEIATLGEFGLIDRLTQDIQPQNPSTKYGVGDDCAVLHYPDSEVLVTTDMLMEGVHFDLTYIDLQHLGWKSAMVNISDIFAMNGTPRQMTVSLALSKRFTVEDLEQFYSGLRLACEKWGVDIVGGDTTSSYTGLAISITCIGEARKDDIVYRNGARETDLICVSGDLGAAYMGLQLLEREKAVYYGQLDELQKKMAKANAAGDEKQLSILNSQFSIQKNFQPDFSGKEYLLQRQLKTEARGDIIQRLREAGIRPTAMMDISDGLSSELMHICKQSHVGCRIFEKQIPIDYQTAVMAEELNMNVTTCALNGGEDYELLFTVPIGDHEKVEALDDVKLIGHITNQSLGHVLVTRDDQEFELKAQGWNPLSSESNAKLA
jgi:thiamine-monophosphate kinase